VKPAGAFERQELEHRPNNFLRVFDHLVVHPLWATTPWSSKYYAHLPCSGR
jgi:hypothetical protein